jgi:lysine-N-methylase
MGNPKDAKYFLSFLARSGCCSCTGCIRMRDTLHLLPEYAGRFRCIGPACEDSCCVGWHVPIDEATYNKYQTIPAGPLRTLVDVHIVPLLPDEEGLSPAQFARIQLTTERACPLLNAEKLCQIQVEQGEAFLSATCATYPRIVHQIEGAQEMALTLSCPEATRLVLLTPDLLGKNPGQHSQFRCNDNSEDDEAGMPEKGTGKPDFLIPGVPLIEHFWPVRNFMVSLLTNRAYPLWQRLFLLGLFTRRLGALARGELHREFAEVLHDFEAAVNSGALRVSIETIPADLRLQLDMVLRLAGLRLPRSHIGQRFLDVIDAFTNGVGNTPEATMESLIEYYAEAHRRWYEPFFHAHPHILENLLINGVFRTLYPFGSHAGRSNFKLDMEREFALLTTQFALMKGLLIGVAGFHGQAFSAEHVVQTVQAAFKHFEHHPKFLDEAYALLVSSQLDNIQGLTMLLRN